MNLLILKQNKIFNIFNNINSENLGFYFSFILHLLILIFAIGLPSFFEPKPSVIPTIIPIEIINISEVTTIPKKIVETKSLKTKQIKVKQKKFNSSNNQEIKNIQTKDLSKIEDNLKQKEIKSKIEKKVISKENIIKEKKQLPLDLQKEQAANEINNFESLPTKKIKPRLKPKPKLEITESKVETDVMVEVKTKPILEPKTIVEAKTKIKPKPQPVFNFASMLKDLRNEKSTIKVESENIEKKEDIINDKKEDEVQETAKLSISEIDLVLQQLSRCFIAPAGAEIKKTMFVKISAKIQQNRRVYESSIRIVDTNISKSSSVYGPITESAMRTLLNPECIPLKLPADKYDLWKNLTMKFDYSVMRGN